MATMSLAVQRFPLYQRLGDMDRSNQALLDLARWEKTEFNDAWELFPSHIRPRTRSVRCEREAGRAGSAPTGALRVIRITHGGTDPLDRRKASDTCLDIQTFCVRRDLTRYLRGTIENFERGNTLKRKQKVLKRFYGLSRIFLLRHVAQLVEDDDPTLRDVMVETLSVGDRHDVIKPTPQNQCRD